MGLAQVKVAFFQKVRFVFQISQSPQKLFQKTIPSLKFEIPASEFIGLNWTYNLKIKSWNLSKKFCLIFAF